MCDLPVNSRIRRAIHSLDRLPRSLMLIAHGPPALSHIGLPLIVASLLCLADPTRDLGNDEVYTWQVFASVSYEKVITSYSVPNNHILHTLLVRLAVQVFGLAEWSLRLAALLAVLAVLPMVYTIGCPTFGSSPAASLVAWIFALSPVHIHYSHSARGYSLRVLMCAMALYAVWRALDGRRLGWPALGLCALVMCALKRDVRSAVYALVSGAATLGALIFAYWPMLEEVAVAGDRWGVAVEHPADLVAAFAAAASYLVAGWAGVLLGLGGLVGLYAAAKYRRSLALYTGLAWLLPFAHRVPER